MLSPSTLRTLLVGGGLGVAALATAALLAQRPAEAQGVMAAPACQCSAPTPIPGISSSVVHCICGAMSCAITEHKQASGCNGNLMQCVR